MPKQQNSNLPAIFAGTTVFVFILYFFSGSGSTSQTAHFLAAKRAITEVLRSKNCGPILVRLAWHDAGTFSKADGTGGSHASMRHRDVANHPANAGLEIARSFLEPIRRNLDESISTADLWQFAGVVAIEHMGGPHVPFRPGRTDYPEAKNTPDGRLPDAKKGASHLRDIFGRMGFTDGEIVALGGAHTIGKCHKERSGFDGPWTDAPLKFDNSFFKDLLKKNWVVNTDMDNGQFKNEVDKTMMLPSDMALLDDPTMKTYVETYAKDQKKFFNDFASAFQKLQELGHSKLQPPVPW
eukprot:TRINITY_DN54813_c0_g1_i1.p1 TRINITY_DN54813_c0_g1~~TRINITY_DN54813_c0_g1_i1.p1  ORF type:complete len:296 (-),score=37.60 TRINITY_DN54813_c0_g1_i1:83-970(-)